MTSPVTTSDDLCLANLDPAQRATLEEAPRQNRLPLLG
jgi:hypothetical protein